MTQKDKMLHMVLDNERLMSSYDYKMEDVEELDIYDAYNDDNAIIGAVARIIKDLDGSVESNTQKQVYKKVFTYLNNKLLTC